MLTELTDPHQAVRCRSEKHLTRQVSGPALLAPLGDVIGVVEGNGYAAHHGILRARYTEQIANCSVQPVAAVT